ncbi:hypothetical protein H6P81_006223 [Aristolochia fimbriata]|uniref:Serine/threonine-protein phosphatase 7 long form-like n=1 Tax=Aristolochia fimbriata TaxID=158543 RepID=A0AAV7EXV2_ARIFI|nr:hypothetical protein H6P81_006223 [Aristolochia fimbriata]
MVYGGQTPAEGDERVERPIVEFIPEEREPSEEANDNSSGEESWPDPVREEVEEEEDVELPLPTMGVPPLEENDEPYPDPWIGVMDMNVTYRNTMVPGVDDDNVPPPVGVGVGQRFMTKDALQMYLKDYCISRHVQFKVHKSGPTVYYVRCTGDQCPWRVYASFSMKMNMWKIRRCNDEYTCLNADLRMDNRFCTSRVICNLIMPNVRTSFTLFSHEIIQLAKDKYHISAIHGFQFCRPFISVDGTHLYRKWLEGGLRCASSLTVTVVSSEQWQMSFHAPIGTGMCTLLLIYGDGIFQAGEHKVVMADTPLLYDQDSHRSEAIWHGETLRHSPVDERMLPYIEAAGFSALHRVQWLRLDKPLITALVERWRSETNTFHLANGEMTITSEDVVVLLRLRVDGDAVIGSTRGDWMELARVLLGVELPPGSFQGGRLSLSWLRGQFSFCPDDATELVCPRSSHGIPDTVQDFEAAGRYSWGAATLAFLYRELVKACRTGVVGIVGCLTLMQVEHPTDECHKPWWKPGSIHDRAGPPAELSGSRVHTPRHAPSDYMRWYLGATRRFISPPPTEPTMVYHPRGYTEEAMLGCVRNVVERVNHREALDPLSADPYLMEIGHYCQSVLHSLPLLEGAIVGGDVSHAGEPSHVVEPARDRAPRRRRARRRPTTETTTRVEDSDEVPAVSEPTVPDLPPEQTLDPEPDQPLELPQEQP